MSAEPNVLDLGDAESGWIADAIAGLASGKPDDLSALISSVDEAVVLEGTRAVVRTHFVTRNGNDAVRVNDLAKHLAGQVIDYCIPRSRVLDANRFYEQTGSSAQFVQLRDEAAGLFTTLEKSGEGGELLLYFLLERVLKLPQLMCKMPLKTSTKMHIHGTDGVHVKGLDGGGLALYWCESKLHAGIGSAVSECFESLAPFLLDDGNGPALQDLMLIRRHMDVGSEALRDELVRYFISDDPKSLQLEYRGACLIGFSLEDYPNPQKADQEALDALTSQIGKWHLGVSNHVGSQSLHEVEIEVFLLPFPSVKDFRDAVRASLGIAQ